MTYENTGRYLKGWEKVINDFKSKIFPIGKLKQEKGCPSSLPTRLKNFTPKQCFIAIVQVKASNTSENLLKEILQIKYFFCF